MDGLSKPCQRDLAHYVVISAMPSIISTFWGKAKANPRILLGIAFVIALHGVALGIMIWSEFDVVPMVAFLLFWGLLNFFWLLLLRRAGPSAALSLAMIAILILLSQFKFHMFLMTVNVVDVMIIDSDTVQFLLDVFPELGRKVGLAALVTTPVFVLIWWSDRLRMPRVFAAAGLVASILGLALVSSFFPLDYVEEWRDQEYVSKFGRTAVIAAIDLITKGLLQSDARASEKLAEPVACVPAGKLPHIILILDESSFDATMLPNLKVVPDYQSRFQSFDGKKRHIVVEGAGGPTWLTEFNVLSGLSVRSFGRFQQSATHIASGRIVRGLPAALRDCGYQTYSLYPAGGRFLGARSYQTTTGIEHFFDRENLGTNERQPDRFYYDFAERLLTWERRGDPMFMLVYTTANHFPWNFTFAPSATPDWRNLGNRPDLDEYLRRQEMSMRDYARFISGLKSNFPDEKFLVVRFGDHQPIFAKFEMLPGLSPKEIGAVVDRYDPRYYTAYYAIDAVNFTPVDLSSALETLDAAYLPLVVLEAAGVPLDPSFAEQKKILQRCHGVFYGCKDGAEARRFNRLLINAGLINGL